MFADLAAAFRRSRHTLVEDLAGAAVLMLALVAALQLPGMV